MDKIITEIMLSLTGIQSIKLRELIKNSQKFNALPLNEQEKMLNKIKKFNPGKQAELFSAFFERENMKEMEEKEKEKDRYLKLIARITEIDMNIKNLVIKDREKNINEDEKNKEEELLNQLKQI